jgi:sphingolipid delta-4 desaturase
MPPHAPVVNASPPAKTNAISSPEEVATRTDFHWVETDEPHATRRRLILAKHPEMKELFGRDIRTFPITVGIFCFQIIMCYLVRNLPWPVMLFLAWVIGGTVNQCLLLIAHELSHNLCFESVEANQLLAIFSNLPTGFPSAITFKRYHMEHHQFQGVDGTDTDLPAAFEARLVGNSIFKKAIWMFIQSAFYALRPPIVRPRLLGRWEMLNVASQALFDCCVYFFLGPISLTYLLAGTVLGMGWHPSAGHFISEHYEFVQGVETYSYYGPMNYVTMNVGYHNEHHDFPKIPWSNLPKVRKIAPEFYDSLPHHDSWCRVLWQYVTDPNLSAFSRVKRLNPTDTKTKSS